MSISIGVTPRVGTDEPRNWKTFDDQTFDFCQGITLHHLPGHTDGLIGMQINMPEMGTYLFISDHCHVIENVGCSSPFPLHGFTDNI